MKRLLLTLTFISTWLLSFAQCPPPQALCTPLVETFESQAAGLNGSGFTNCWRGTTTSVPRWESEDASGSNENSSSTGPFYDATLYPQAGGIYIYMETSGGSLGDTAGFMSPDIDLTNLTNPELSFSYHMYGATMGELEVQIWNGVSWDSVWAVSGAQQLQQADPFIDTSVSLASYSGTIKVKFLGTRGSSFTGDMSIDDIRIDDPASCPNPTSLSANGVTSVQADIVWDAGTSGASSWEVRYGTIGTVQCGAGGTLLTPSTDSVQITGLLSSTTYEVFVREACSGGGFSQWVGPATFTTLCAPFTAPYSRDFDMDSDGADPLCWAQYNNFNALAYARVETPSAFNATQPFSSPNFLEIYSYFNFAAGDTLMAISPQFSDMTAGDKQIRFQVATQDNINSLYVGTTSSQTPGAALNYIDTITFSTNNTWEEIIIPITTASGYNGTDQFVFLQHSLDGTFDDIYVDDFNYEVIPPCPKITGINVNSVSTNSVTISFSSSGTSFDYEWGPTGFGQGTGTFGSITGGSPQTLTGLAPSTTYDLYLRNNCTGAGNGTSIWSGPITFQTQCFFVAPYIEQFTTYTPGENGPNINGCISGNSTVVPRWETEDAEGFNENSSGTGPFYDATTFGVAGGMYLYLETSGGTTNDSDYFETPAIDVSGLNVPYLEFDYHMFGAAMGNLQVDYNDGSGWVNMTTIIGQQQTAGSDPWLIFGDTLSNLTSDTVTVRFIGFRGTSFTSDMSVDDIEVKEAPTCAAPANLALVSDSTSAVSAFITFSGGSGIVSQIEWGTSGFTPFAGQAAGTASITDTFYSITGLASNTVYEVYVRDSCGSSFSSSVGPVIFTTKCAAPSPTSLPFTDGFENYAGTLTFQGEANLCSSSYNWAFEGASSASRLRLAAGTGYYNTGVQAATLDHSPSASAVESNFLILTVNLTNYTTATGIELGFAYMSHGQEASLDNRVWVRGSASDAWVEIYDLDAGSTGNGIYNLVTNLDIVGPLTNAGQAVGANTQIRFGQAGRFGSFSTSFSDGYTFDDIELRTVTCPTPSGLGLSALLDTSATLSWNANANATGYEVWFGPQGFYQGTTTVGGVRNYPASNSLLVDTLSSQTCYEYLIRYVCAPGDTSDYAGPFQFCTPCSPFFAPYLENFDAMTTNQTPDCFEAILLGGTAPFSAAEVYSFGSPRSAPNHIRFYNYNNSTTMLVSPLFGDITAGDKRVVMYARETFADGELLIIGTVPSPASYQSFSALDTFTMSTVDQKLITNIDAANGYNGTDQYVAILHGNTGTFNTIYIDDFAYQVIPTCPEPLTGSTVNAGDVSATVTFISGGAANFQIDLGAPGFTPSGASANLVNATTTTVNLTGLTPNTAYEWYVRDSCGIGDVSTWTGPFSFVTACAPFTAPYSEDFENHTLGFFKGQDNCWTLENTVDKAFPTSGYGWELRNTVQTSSGTSTGALGDNTLYPAIGGQFFNADVSYGGSGDSSMLISPIVDISGLTSPELEYHLHRFGSNMADFYVDIYDGTSWINGVHSYTNLAGIQTGQADAYTDTIIDLTPYAGTTNFRVRFRTVSNGCCAGDNGLDDIRISDPLTGDMDLVTAEFIKGLCLSTNDSLFLQVVNKVAPVDLSIDPLDVFYDVTGPANTNGSLTINSGQLAIDDTLDLFIGGIDLSQVGSYNLKAWIDTSFINQIPNRDTIDNVTLDVRPEFGVNPKSVVVPSINDSVELCVESSFFGGGEFLITEQCQFKTTNGAPAGGWPAYLTTDDYIEITGVPGADLGGITLEQYNTTGLAGTYTFPSGTFLSPNGTAIIAVGQLGASVPDPSNFYYHGNGTYTGLWSSSTQSGRILRAADGTIIDAVISNAFTWPAVAGVTPADWSGTVPATGGSAGNRLEGPDLNNGTGWVASATSAQDPGVVNANVPAPKSAGAPGLQWTLNGNVVDTVPCITVGGPFSSTGTLLYIVSYTNACGTFTDTVTVVIPNCSAPTNLMGISTGSNSVSLTWDTTGTGAINFDVEYGAPGFALGNGTRVTATGTGTTVTGLATNLCQDYYVRASCSASDSSAWIGPLNVCPDATLCLDDFDQYNSGADIESQSALFIPWQGAGGDSEVSTSQSSSGAQSLRVTDLGPAGFTDIVAYFDTINTGAWELSWQQYVPTNDGGYYNIQQNHSLTGVGNQWNAEVYFLGNGTGQIQHSAAATVVGTFNYNQAQWFKMSTIIDLNNDTIWFAINDTAIGLGYDYSDPNPGAALQFNGVNFYSGVLAGQTYDIDYYVDDFCVSPYSSANCAAPSNLGSSNITCTSADLTFTSNNGATQSWIEYGPAGFAPLTGAGTIVWSGSPANITGLTPGTAYDFYVADTCASDTSGVAGPSSFTTANGPISASFSFTLGTAGATNLNVSFDASASQGATSYDWDFGDGNTGTGQTPSHLYTSNGDFYACLTVTGPCGTDTICDTVKVRGISLNDYALANSLLIYPNPTKGAVRISFETDAAEDITISLMDITGKVISTREVNNLIGKFEESLDLSDFAHGTYMLRIESSQGAVTRRIIRE